MIPPPVALRRTAIAVSLCITGLLAISERTAAAPGKPFSVIGTGRIVFQIPCSETEICQEAHIEGQATRIGQFTGVLFERVDLTTFTYTGTGTFTTPNGDSLSTTYTGIVVPPDAQGVSSFLEDHEIVAGTGKYDGVEGELQVSGTADANLHLNITGTGTLSK